MAGTDLWEDTIVLALRDVQWQQALKAAAAGKGTPTFPNASLPHGMLKLDGRAESKLGDVVARFPKETFCIFEVKSGPGKIRDEWRKGRQKGRKIAYWALKHLVDEANRQFRIYQAKKALEQGLEAHEVDPVEDGFRPENELLRHSLRGHHLAYWYAAEARGDINGAIVFEPYVLGAALARNEKDLTKPELLQSLDWEYRMMSRSPGAPIKEASQCLNVEDIPSASVIPMTLQGEASDKHSALPVGLEGKAFVSYVEFLCQQLIDERSADGHEEIHAVILSSRGGFMRVLRSTRDLVALLSGDLTLARDYKPSALSL